MAIIRARVANVRPASLLGHVNSFATYESSKSHTATSPVDVDGQQFVFLRGLRKLISPSPWFRISSDSSI